MDRAYKDDKTRSAKVKELISVELPIIEVKDNSMDFVFLLEDNTYLHLEF